MAKLKEKEAGFEESLKALERIVAQLESGDLPLERALELFEDGVGLARRCQSQLEEAERKVELLLRERGEIKVVPFEPKAESPASESEKLNVAYERTQVLVVSESATKSADEKENDFDDVIPF
jgi:exodeoxyribonuclease VII small subunit